MHDSWRVDGRPRCKEDDGNRFFDRFLRVSIDERRLDFRLIFDSWMVDVRFMEG